MENSKKTHAVTGFLLLLILLVSTLSHLTSDMYVPSLPSIAVAFNADPSFIQATFSFYLLGFAASHLFYGPVSDRIGRKKPILFGIVVSIIGGTICFSAPYAFLLLLGRFIQGCGAGACNSVGRALVRDLFSGRYLAKINSQIGMLIVSVVIVAPMIGSYIQYFFSWRSIFLLLTLYTFFILVLVFFKLPETNLHLDGHATRFPNILKNYKEIIANKTFIGYTICMGCAYAGIIIYMMEAPFILQNNFGMTVTEYSWTYLVIGSSFFVSSFINGLLIVKKGIPVMILYGIFLMILSGILMFLMYFYNKTTVVGIVAYAAIFSIGCGLTFANAGAGALSPFSKRAGSAGAMFGFLQISIGSLMSMMVAFFPYRGELLLSTSFSFLGVISVIALIVLCDFSIKSLITKENFVSSRELD